MKTITINEILWSELSYRKVKHKDRTLNDTIKRLLNQVETLEAENEALMDEVCK